MSEQVKNRVAIAAVITCFNRKQQTLDCIAGLKQQAVYGDGVEVFLLDDGSVDGTSAAVRQMFPEVHVSHGGGQCYWNGGMRVAFQQAQAGAFDFYLWLNDDTRLHTDALRRMVETYRLVATPEAADAIVVGSTADPETGKLSYGGWRSASQFKRLTFGKVTPDGKRPVECDSMNGNCVLIPRSIAHRIGNLDPAFTHGMGDIDYGLRARENGFRIWVAPGFIGLCTLNPGKGLWQDTAIPLRDRWKRLLGPKGLPPKEWLVFTRRHAGRLWPLYWMNPYLSFWLRGLSGK